MNDNRLARKIDKSMNNKYVESIEVINLDDIIQDLFISDEIKEELSEEGFFEHYVGGDFEVLVIDYNYDKTLVALNNFSSDPAEYIFHCMDGTVWAASMLPAMEYDDGGWYAGDEIIQVSQIAPYANKNSWCYRSLLKVDKCKHLRVSKETMKKIISEVSSIN